MFGGPKIKVEKDMYERLEKVSEAGGYSSVDEFVQHILERELGKLDPESSGDPEAMREKLRGLGYIS